jgi:hypothetical protein
LRISRTGAGENISSFTERISIGQHEVLIRKNRFNWCNKYVIYNARENSMLYDCQSSSQNVNQNSALFANAASSCYKTERFVTCSENEWIYSIIIT